MHACIKKWAKTANPGDVYQTAVSIIVARSFDRDLNEVSECPACGSDDLDYGDFEAVESGDIEQTGWCLKCGEQWQDVFVLSERHELCKRGV